MVKLKWLVNSIEIKCIGSAQIQYTCNCFENFKGRLVRIKVWGKYKIRQMLTSVEKSNIKYLVDNFYA